MFNKEQTIKILESLETNCTKIDKIESQLSTIFNTSGEFLSPFYDLVSDVISVLNEEFSNRVDKDFFSWWLFEFNETTKEERKLFMDGPEGEDSVIINIRTPQELADYLFD